MKRFKSCRAYGAFEYVIIAAIVIILGIIASKTMLGKMKEGTDKNLSPMDSTGPVIENAVDSTKITVSLNEIDELIYEYDSNMLDKEDIIKEDFKNYIINDVLENKKLVLDNTASYSKEDYEVKDIFLVIEDDVLRFMQFRIYDKNKGTSSDNINAKAVDAYIKEIYIDAYDNEHYSDEYGFSGVLEKYLYSGELIEEHTKFITDYHQANYNQDGYTGILSLYPHSTGASHTKWVTNQTSANYNSDGYTGTLNSYSQTISGPSRTQSGSRSSTTHWNQGTTSPSFPSSISYNSGEYSGTLYKSGSPSSSIITRSSSSGVPRGSASTSSEAVSQVRSIVIGNGFGWVSGSASGSAATGWTVSYSYNEGRNWTQSYSGTVYGPSSTVTRYQGNVTKPGDIIYRYQGDVTKPEINTRVYKYRGYATR